MSRRASLDDASSVGDDEAGTKGQLKLKTAQAQAVALSVYFNGARPTASPAHPRRAAPHRQTHAPACAGSEDQY